MFDKAGILIVGEDEETLSAAAHVIGEAGYDVLKARTGTDCLELVRLERPDLVLLSALLPDMEGMEVCRRIKGDAQLAGTFVLLVSDVRTSSDTWANGLTAGADGTIVRPIGNRELLARVQAMVRIKRTEDALRLSQARERHLNAVLRGLRNVNQLITKESDRECLIQRACENLTESLGYQKAWIVLVGENGEMTASGDSGFDRSFSVFQKRLDRREWPECARKAFTTAGIIVSKDVMVDCGDCPLAVADVHHARLCTRLECEDYIYGVLCVTVTARYVDDEEEQDLFHELASDIAFALRRIDSEDQRRAAQKALSESEERNRFLAGILEHSSQPFAVGYADGRVAILNSAFRDLLGYDEAELREMDWIRELTPPEWRKLGARHMAELVRTGKPVRYEKEYFRKDGSRVPVELLVHLLHDETGQTPDCTYAFVTDLTERKRTEEALRESEKRYRELFQYAPVGIFQTTSEGRTLSANPQMAGMVGSDSSEEAVATFTDLARQLYADPRRRDAFVGLLAVNGEVRDFEYEAICLDGVHRWLSMTARISERHSDGTFVIDGFTTDVTESKQAEEALRESAEKLRAIVDNVGIGIALISPRMEVLEMNRQLREWFPNVNPVDRPICYTSFNDPPRDGVCDYCPARLTLADGLLHEAVTETPQAGGIRNYRVIASAIRDAENKVVGVIEIVEDISDRRQLEAQLHQAQKMEAVGRLAGGVAHDFNNMLSVILGYTDMILNKLDPIDPLCKDLQEVRGAAERSANLTRQLLAFSRRQTIAPVVMDLNAQLKTMERLLHRILGEDIEMKFILRPDLLPIRMDPAQIDQIVANLAVNSRDAMPDGGRLTVETANVALDDTYCMRHVGFKPGEYVLLAVSDSGCGMDKETLDHIFEPFFTTKEPGKGTGLGLATVYGVVKQNNGYINVYSEPGEGTTIKLYIPRHMGAKESDRVSIRATGPVGGTETILLAEDEEQLRRLAKAILERGGYTVIDASGPGEAVVACEKHTGDIHLLLTDVVMPIMNGRELEQRIHALRPSVKTLFMSGYTSDAIAYRRVLDKGVHFLQKPFTREILLKKVREVLDED